ncbi:MAG: ribosome recycling factor [Candidatus Pacebacteria bacterium]|nr:ribosome recycling factor [Candidatus Paceibacterota bacterium]
MAFNYTKLDAGLKESAEWLGREYSRLHTGRASPAYLDGVMVEAYGSFQPIKNVGSVNIEDARTLRISLWDKSVIKDVEKSITAANLGVSVSSDSEGLRVNFPVLTTENRSRLVKVLKDKLEEARISVRKERESAMSELKAAGLPEDEDRRTKDDIQKRVDGANQKLEELFSGKEEEVMS